jgi:nesprin-1
MHETGERWKNVSMELRCVQSMLEEVVAYWRRWNTLADEFESWLDRAYGLLDLPEEDKMEYFQVISRVKGCVNLNVQVVFVHNFENFVMKNKSKNLVW